jgi:hypothetical protein
MVRLSTLEFFPDHLAEDAALQLFDALDHFSFAVDGFLHNRSFEHFV